MDNKGAGAFGKTKSYGLDRPSPTVIAKGMGPGGGPARTWIEGTEGEDGAASTTKPAYRVPSMVEVNDLPYNGLTVVSTFSGAGGSCTGYRMAGYRILWANEFEPNAALCYAANHPTTVLDKRDIRSIEASEITEAIDGAEIDLFDGSPPCQSFSTAGSRSKIWGLETPHVDGTHQRSDDLFFEYARLLRALQPRAFVAENVFGLVGGVSKGMFKRIMATLKDCGYRVRARVLDAQWLGVPQHRQRVFIIGMREDLGIDPVHPSPFGYRYSMLDACPWLRSAQGFEARTSGFGPGHQPTNDLTDPMHTVVSSQHESQLVYARNASGFIQHAIDPNDPMPTIKAADGVGTGKFEVDDLRTQFATGDVTHHSLSDPAPTVMAAGIAGRKREQASVKTSGRSLDPETGQRLKADLQAQSDRRRLTIPEIRRFCSFPDDYVLFGSYIQRWARLGNSVPPLMARTVGDTLATVLLP